MSESTCKDESTTAARGSSSDCTAGDAEADRETSPPGKFKPWGPVARLIQARFGGTTQLVAFQLARHTPPDGVCHMTAPVMAKITKWSEVTCRDALAEIVAHESKLVARKRTRDGYVYTWSREAYTGVGVAGRGQKFSSCSGGSRASSWHST